MPLPRTPSAVLWGLIGYSLAYGPNTNSGVIGDGTDAFVQFGSEPHVLPGPTPTTLTITENVYMVYELTFAIITAAIMSGSVVSRMRYLWFLAFVAFWHIFVYCPLAFWIFNTGERVPLLPARSGCRHATAARPLLSCRPPTTR